MGFHRSLVAVATLVTSALILTPHTLGYSTYAKWPTLSVPFYVNPANSDVSLSAAISSIQGAMGAWNNQAGTPFRFTYAGQVNDTVTSNDGRNVVIFRQSTNGGAIASTYTWRSNGILIDADIIFWDAGFKFFGGSSGCVSGVYIEDVGAHEFGHALGMSHSSVAGATMTPGYSGCTTTQRSLESDDKAGAQKLYGTSGAATNTAPSVTVSAPSSGLTVTAGTAIGFSGSATDTQQGSLTSQLVWRSHLDGQIGTGGSFSRTLTAGVHTITATVTDSGGLTAQATRSVTVTASPVNTSPSVTILNPANGLTVTATTAITFSGSATDTQQGNLTSQLVWRSNLDGQIGTGASFSRTLRAGVHTITATVTDSGGLTAQASRTVTVTSSTSTNTAPSVTITSPASGLTVKSGTLITFTGSASDAQQGNLTSQLTWSSSLSNHLASGGNFSMTLKSGTHTITAKVTDSGGLTAQKAITVVVVVP